MLPNTTPNGPTATLSGRVASNIRGLMAAQRRSSSELAAVLDRDVRAAQRRLHGDQDFSLNEIEIVARWMGVPAHILMAEILPARLSVTTETGQAA